MGKNVSVEESDNVIAMGEGSAAEETVDAIIGGEGYESVDVGVGEAEWPESDRRRRPRLSLVCGSVGILFRFHLGL